MMMRSEYDRSYQWNPALNRFNGQQLKAKHNLSEPMMTHKRRVKLTEDNVIIGEPLPSQNNDYNKEDPYFVLGDKNKKFHPSVPYRNIRAFDQSKPVDKSHKIQQKLKSKNKVEYRKQAKVAKFVNEEVQTDEDFQIRSKIAAKAGDKATQVTPKTPEPLETKEHDIRADNHSKQMSKINQFVGKGNQPPVSQSEYQTKYAWKERFPQQGLAFDKASQNKSKFDMKLKIYNNFMSEYQRQYRPYEFVGENRFRRMKSATAPSFEDSNIQIVPERPKIERRAVTPPPVWKHRKSEETVPVAPQQTLNPQRASFPHGRQKRFVTEYSANFDNKWQRLEAEIQRSLEEEQARQSNQQSRWFKEILDLRKKAQEYRQRARGTHFSREHLGEIFTKNRRRDSFDTDDHQSMGDAYESRDKQILNGMGNKRSKARYGVRDSIRRRSVSGSIGASCSSLSNSTIAERPRGHSSSARSSPTRNVEWQSRFAGKPSYDNSLLLDEEASHDTDIKEDGPGCREGSRQLSPGHTYPGRLPDNLKQVSSGHTYPGRSPDNFRRVSPGHSYPGRSPDNSRRISPERCADVGRTAVEPPQPSRGHPSHLGNYDMRHTVPVGPARRTSPTPDTRYSLQRYFNSDKPSDARNMSTLPYEAVSGIDSSVSKVSSVRSFGSSTSRSLALETLERARRNRDQVLNLKT